MKIENKSRIIKELIPLIIVIIIALFILPVRGVPVTNAAAQYLQKANKILHGQGPGIMSQDVLTARRPLFPMILALGFKLGGKSVQSASLVTRLFFALEIILIYLIGRIFYSITVGLLSSGLFLSSYGINFIARYINTDIVLPFFILLFILIYYIALTRSSRIWAVFAGISLGLALLVKESALLCLGLPLGMVFLAPKGKKWEYGKLGLFVIGTLFIPLLSWIIYMFLTNDSFLPLIDAAYSGATYRMRPFSDWIYLFTTGFPKTIFKYYQSFLQGVTPLSFLLILGWLFVFIRGLISKKTSDLILTITLVCSLPLILQIADEGDRLGQTTRVYMFLYITLAAFVVSCISLLNSYVVKFSNKYRKNNIFNSVNRKYPRLISNLLIILVGVFLIRAQLFAKNNPTWKEWTKESYPLCIFFKKPFEVYHRYTIWQQEAAEWLKKNAKKNATIIADGYTHEALDFFDVADYEIPIFHLKRGVPLGSITKRDDKVQPLYLILYSSFDSGSQRHRVIYPIFEEDIVSVLKKQNPDYLVISGRGLFIKAYFEQAEWACLKLDNNRVRIYEIHLDKFKPVTSENVGVNETINEHLIWLEENYPDEYLLFKEDMEALGLTIDELKNSQLRFPIGQVY